MRGALKAVFLASAVILATSAVLTVAGSAFNLEPVLRAAVIGWFLGCLLLFSWGVLLALCWVRSRDGGGGGPDGGPSRGLEGR